MDTLDKSATELAKEYEAYFDTCEKANKVPLSFRQWLKKEYNIDSND